MGQHDRALPQAALTGELLWVGRLGGGANYPWLGAIFIWNLNFQANVPPSDEKWGFSVLRSDFSPRPAYSALAAMPKS